MKTTKQMNDNVDYINTKLTNGLLLTLKIIIFISLLTYLYPFLL